MTGEPLWPIEERPVPAVRHARRRSLADAAVPDRAAAVRAAEVHRGRSESVHRRPEERARFLDDIRSARNEGLFTPPGLRNTIQMPGNNGGANWGGAAVDPEHGTMFVVSKDFPCMLKLCADQRRRRASAALLR